MVESVSYGTYSAAVLIMGVMAIALIWFVDWSAKDSAQADGLIVKADNQTALRAVIKDYETKGYQVDNNAVVMMKVPEPRSEIIPTNATLNLNCTTIQLVLTGKC